ncbi:endonuclease/exonuclease/phosphatase family protein [Aliikangiella sp. IMCC44653]
MDFPRLQIALCCCIVLLANYLWLNLNLPIYATLTGLTLACFIFQLWWITPYTLFWPVEVKSTQPKNNARTIKIITSNVLQTNRNAKALIDLVNHEQPDILVTLETDHWWQQQLDCLQAEMPHCIKCPLDNLYGMHVYSKLPLSHSKILYLVEENVPSIHTQALLACGETVSLHFLHPAPPSPTENELSQARDAELILVAKRVKFNELPTIVAGDLNDVAWSRTTRLFRKISGLLDPRIGRGMFNTFHAKLPLFRWPLDHLFHSKHFTMRNVRRLPSIGSDHFPLYSELHLEPVVQHNGNDLNLDSEDLEFAQNILDKQAITSDISKLKV